MFGSNKKEDQKIVGARKKLELARKHAKNYDVLSKRESGMEPNPLLAIVVIWGLAIGLSVLLTDGVLKAGLDLSVGNPDLDKLLFGPGEPNLTNSPETDYVLALFVRGLAIFVIAGIIPGLTALVQRLLDRVYLNVYLTFWGVSIFLVLLYVAGKDMMVTVFKALVSVAT